MTALWAALLTLSAAVPVFSAEPLPALFQEYYEFRLKESPELATMVGRRDYNDRWSDPSPQHLRERRTALDQFLTRLHSIPLSSVSRPDQLSYRILEWDLKDQIEAIDLLGGYSTINHYLGGHIAVFRTMDVAPAETVKDYQDQLARLRALPQFVDRTIAAAQDAIEHRRVQPKLVARLVASQLDLEMASGPDKSPLLAAFRKFPTRIAAAEQRQLAQEADSVYRDAFLPAWRKLRDYVNGEYMAHARDTLSLSALPDGPKLYAFRVRSITTTNYTPRQIHHIGLQEVARIQAEMAAIQKELGFSGTPQEFTDQVLNGPKFRFHTEGEILVHGRDIAKRLDPQLPKLFKVLPRMTYGVTAIPADRARTSAPHYEPPALDGSRAGYIFLRTVDPEKQTSCCMEALLLHEAVPGHHLQIALASEMNVPDFRKITYFTAYTEGWGLYAETLGQALGMYETPYERYGQLASELFRATRLVVDTGLHSKRWSRQQAIDYMFQAGANPSRDFLASEVDRYVAMPGQALAYKIGALKIQELRALAEKEAGAKFNIRDFHDVVLRNGALPLELLEEQVRQWMARVY